MRSVNVVGSLIVSLSLFSVSSTACERPSSLKLPDPNSATRAEVLLAAKQVKQYVAASNRYMECTRSDKRYRRVSDDMNEMIFRYNELAFTYKARSVTSKSIATR